MLHILTTSAESEYAGYIDLSPGYNSRALVPQSGHLRAKSEQIGQQER